MEDPNSTKERKEIELETNPFKEAADEAFRRRDFTKAINLYTVCIAEHAHRIKTKRDEYDWNTSNLHVLHANRSGAFAGAKKYSEALNDAEESIRINPKWPKGYYRKGIALSRLEKHTEASLSFKDALELEPNNVEYKKMSETAQKKGEIEDWYRSSVNDLPIKVTYLEYKKQRGVLSTTRIPKGKTIFSESPLISTQFQDNKEKVEVCEYCLQSLESPRDSLQRYVTADLKEESLPFNEECYKKVSKLKCSNCDEVYCSQICKSLAWERYHKLMCTTPNDSNDSIRRIQLFCKTNKNHIPWEVAKIFSVILCSNLKKLKTSGDCSEISGKECLSPFHLFKSDSPLEQPSNELVTKSAQKLHPSSSFYYDETNKRFEDSFYSETEFKMKQKGLQLIFDLTQSALRSNETISIADKILTYDNFRFLYGIIALNSQVIAPLSPYMIYWNNIKSLPTLKKDEALAKLVPSLVSIPRNIKRVESSRGSGLFKISNCINHFCVPNVEISFNHNDFKLEIVALRDIKEGEELYQSFVDPSLPKKLRSLILKVQYLVECVCPKCREETEDDETIDALISRHIRTIQSQLSLPTNEGGFMQIYDHSVEDKLRIKQEEKDMNLILNILDESKIKRALASHAISEISSFDVKKRVLNEILSQEAIEKLHKIRLKSELDFEIEKRVSNIPNAGFGVFLKRGFAKKGSIICFYSGVCFFPEDVQFLRSNRSPLVQYLEKNEYLMKRFDGILIDGNTNEGSECDKILKARTDYTENPLELGSFVNHSNNQSNNLLHYELNLKVDGSTRNLLRFQYFNPKYQSLDVLRMVVGIATKDIKEGEEILTDYRYPLISSLPDWYIPVIDVN